MIKGLEKTGDRKKLILIILVLAATAFSAFVMYRAGYVYSIFPLLILALLCFIRPEGSKKYPILNDVFAFLVYYVNVVYFFQLSSVIEVAEANGLIYLSILLHDGMVFLLLVPTLFVYLLLRSFLDVRVTSIIAPIPFALLAATNYYLLVFRGNGFVFSDFYSHDTAANVVGEYHFNIIIPLALMIIPYFCSLVFVYGLKTEKKTYTWLKEAAVVAAAVLMLFLTIGVVKFWGKDHKLEMWGYNAGVYNGFYMNFGLSIANSFKVKPDGYSTEALDAYAGAVTPDTTEEYPKILVIMNESYMDVTTFPEITGNIDIPDPYWRSLSENTVHGYALSSVFGGNTANSEFEFLTSLSTAFIPRGAVVYSQFIDSEIHSLPRYLEQKGYTTSALHPYLSDGWNRTNVYPLMGFDSMHFIEDFSFGNEDVIRGYLSDKAAYRNVIDMMRQESGPQFSFLITMQNHGSYDGRFDNFPVTEYVGDFSADTYINLVSKSDEALEYLIAELSEEDDKYVVLIFGDHQPKLQAFPEDFEAGGRSWVIPYIIWANYDIPQETLDRLDHTSEYTSINYLALDLLDVAGIGYDPYYSLVSDIREGVPSINQIGYRESGSGEYIQIDDDHDNGLLSLYDYLLYDVLFDKEASSITAVD